MHVGNFPVFETRGWASDSSCLHTHRILNVEQFGAAVLQKTPHGLLIPQLARHVHACVTRLQNRSDFPFFLCVLLGQILLHIHGMYACGRTYTCMHIYLYGLTYTYMRMHVYGLTYTYMRMYMYGLTYTCMC
jgi:hypothetical protein